MFSLRDAQLGHLIQTCTVLGFTYYLLWMTLTPFVNRDHFLQHYFPPREYGVIVPCLITCLLLGVAYTIYGLSAIFEFRGSRFHIDAANGKEKIE